MRRFRIPGRMLNPNGNEIFNGSFLERPPTDGWRLSDKEFDELHRIYKFAVEGCCAALGLNGQKGLPFYSKENYLLDHDVSGQLVYCNPPWSLAIHCVEHLRACHSRSPLDTRAVIGLCLEQSLRS